MSSATEPIALVGTYADAGGEGLYPLLRRSDGGLEAGEPLPQAQNASFGVYSSRHRLHYLVDERDSGAVGAFRWNGHEIARLAAVPTGGARPCYVALDPGETALAVANYGSGSCAVLPLDLGTGLPTGERLVRENQGRGPVAGRQDGPHAHCAIFSPAGDRLFQTDLGTDEVLAFAWDSGTGELGEAALAYRAPPGSGPRHLLFSANGSLAYLLCELAASLTVLRVEGSRLLPHQTLPLLAEPESENLGGHLAFDAGGARLIATNRGHDSIAVFDVLDDGTLRRGPLTSSGGQSPRHFLIDGGEMLVLHENSGSIRRMVRTKAGAWALAGGPIRVPGGAFLIAPAAAGPVLAGSA